MPQQAAQQGIRAGRNVLAQRDNALTVSESPDVRQHICLHDRQVKLRIALAQSFKIRARRAYIANLGLEITACRRRELGIKQGLDVECIALVALLLRRKIDVDASMSAPSTR